MAIIKCTQLHGLADKSDYTCETLPPNPDLHLILTSPDGTADLVMWTKYVSLPFPTPTIN